MTGKAKKPAKLTKVENGKRIKFDHPSAAGMAGLVESNGRIELAYPRHNDKQPPAFSDEIKVGDEKFIVISVDEIRRLKMIKLSLGRLS